MVLAALKRGPVWFQPRIAVGDGLPFLRHLAPLWGNAGEFCRKQRGGMNEAPSGGSFGRIACDA
jgi:hypothetical protein